MGEIGEIRDILGKDILGKDILGKIEERLKTRRVGTFWDTFGTFWDVLGRFGTLLGQFGMFWDV